LYPAASFHAEPFSGVHPDTGIEVMYEDRVSAEGLVLWRPYTDEYVSM
jgi:hypothetical protein